MIHIVYKIWFALKLEIEDYSGDVLDVCDLIPTERCARNLQNARILVKKRPNLLTHLIEVTADGPDVDKPVYTPMDNLAFKYQLLDKGGRMHQRTNVDSFDLANHTLYLNNNANNKVGADLFLHKTGSTITSADHVFKGMFEEVEAGALAVIDIFQNALVALDYRLLDSAGKCKEPVFVIRFAKRI